MHFLLNLLRIKSRYMFRALLAHSQVSLYKLHFVYCVRVMSVESQSWCSSLTQHVRNIPSAVCLAPHEDEQVILEIRSGP
jgi:hypothetical protein